MRPCSFEYCVSSDVQHQLKNDLYPTKSQSEIWHCELKAKKNTIHCFTWKKNTHYVVSVEVFFVVVIMSSASVLNLSLFSLRQRIVAYGEPHTFADTFTLCHGPHGKKKVEQIRKQQQQQKNGTGACVCVSRACLISLYRTYRFCMTCVFSVCHLVGISFYLMSDCLDKVCAHARFYFIHSLIRCTAHLGTVYFALIFLLDVEVDSHIYIFI